MSIQWKLPKRISKEIDVEKKNSKGISDHIKEQFDLIQPHKALSCSALVQELMNMFPTIKDRTSGSARVNLVLGQKKVSEKFTKLKGKDHRVYIIRKEDEPNGRGTSTETTSTEKETSPELEQGQERVGSEEVVRSQTVTAGVDGRSTGCVPETES